MVALLNKIVAIKSIRPYTLRVQFSDGATGSHDFTPMVEEGGPMLDEMRNPDYFARVFLRFGAPTWPNGFDMCPDWVRMELERAGTLNSEHADPDKN